MLEIMLNVSILLICIFAVIGVFTIFKTLYKWLTNKAIMKEIEKNPELLEQYYELIKAQKQIQEFIKSIEGEEV